MQSKANRSNSQGNHQRNAVHQEITGKNQGKTSSCEPEARNVDEEVLAGRVPNLLLLAAQDLSQLQSHNLQPESRESVSTAKNAAEVKRCAVEVKATPIPKQSAE